MYGKLNTYVLFIFLCCYFCGVHVAAEGGPIVETSLGTVEGIQTAEALVFKSIPYGGEVDGNNRWLEAQPAKPWTGTLDGTRNPPACPQNCDPDKLGGACPPHDIPQEENCLFLNVFTPVTANSHNPTLPVLVFIHGGGYIVGYSASPVYDGSYLASHSNIIVVTLNYRLGALGFLVYGGGSGDESVYGNLGIKDQRLALKWVQMNIAAFGGDPNKVTLSGESAGAMSVAIHMTNNKSNGLFHKAIIESDLFGIDYRTVAQEKHHGSMFVAAVELLHKCWPPYNNLKCLRELSMSQVLKAQYYTFPALQADNLMAKFFSWAPVIDGKELTNQPLALFKEGTFTKVPVIIGTTSHEAIVFIYKAIPFEVWAIGVGLSDNGTIFCKAMVCGKAKTWPYKKIAIPLLFGSENKVAALKLYPPIPSGILNPKDQRIKLSEAMGDYVFCCPTLLSARKIAHFASNVPVYSYIFNQSMPSEGKELCNIYSCHGAELSYVFHTYELCGLEYTPEEEKLADIASEYWGNFVNSGNPNNPPGTEGSCDAEECTEALELPPWPQFNIATEESLIMDAQNLKIESKYRKEEFCDIVDNFGYGRDLFGVLRDAADMVLSMHD